MNTQMEIEKKFSQCGEYIILETLGSGFHAKVKLAEKDGKKVAIKIFRKQHNPKQNIKALTNEILILQKLNHPNLINLIEFNNPLPYRRKNGQTEQCVCIILELAQGGELFEYIASSGRFAPETSRYYFKQLLSALIYIKNKGICHRDLKLENILLDSNFNLKVADFGFAKIMETAKQKTNLGSPMYMAPEIVANREYNGTKADIFSTGVILFILHAGSPPFSTASDRDPLFKLLLNNKRDKFWSVHVKNYGKQPEFFPQDFMDLIEGMLAPNPDQRFTLDQCLQHPWTNGPVATPEQIQNEFQKRYGRVQAEIQASKMKLQAQKAAQQQPNIGKFRSSTIIGETKEEDFTEIIEKHQLNLQNRILKKSKDTGFQNEFKLYLDPNFLFCYLLKHCAEFNSKVKKIYDTKYKINFEIDGLIDESLEYQLEILDCENEMLKLNFTKLSGDYIQFKQVNTRIKEAIQKNYEQFLKVEIQQV